LKPFLHKNDCLEKKAYLLLHDVYKSSVAYNYMNVQDCKSELKKDESMFEGGDFSKTEEYLRYLQMGEAAGILSEADVEQCYLRAKVAMEKGYNKLIESAGTELKQRDNQAVYEYKRELRSASNAYVKNIEQLLVRREEFRHRPRK